MSDRSACLACTAPAGLFLCRRCVTELRDRLHALAHGPEVNGKPTTGLLDALADVALKRTCMGGGGGHRKKGDELPAPFLPDNGKMVKDKKTGQDTNEPVPSPQGWASTLLASASNTLSTIVRDVCESRSIDVMRAFRVVPAGFIGPLMPGWRRAVGFWSPTLGEQSDWLAAHAHALACDESAGQWYSDVDRLTRQITRSVDRPISYEILGWCATELDGTTCGQKLRAPEGAIEVRCPKCHTVRRCDFVRNMSQRDANRAPITWAKLLETNRLQPDDRRVNERTLRDWRRYEILKPQIEGEDLYRWDDVVQLRGKRVDYGLRKRTRAGK